MAATGVLGIVIKPLELDYRETFKSLIYKGFFLLTFSFHGFSQVGTSIVVPIVIHNLRLIHNSYPQFRLIHN